MQPKENDSGDPTRLDGRSLTLALRDEEREPRSSILLEFHGIRYLYSERAIVTNDGWKYVFSPGDTDEVYDLNREPAKLKNLVGSTGDAKRIDGLTREHRSALAEANDPIAKAVFKLMGIWDHPTAPSVPNP